jgi:antitoxin FitA
VAGSLGETPQKLNPINCRVRAKRTSFRLRYLRKGLLQLTALVMASVMWQMLLPLNALARCPHCWHYESMATQINIRDVPEKVRDELAARAALQGKSMQEFLRAELERLAARPSIDAWLQQVRKRKLATQTRISSKQILENRNADRR